MKKKLIFLLFIAVNAFLTAQQQQITRFAVIDTALIYSTFRRDSKSVRDYEQKKQKYQADIQMLSDEIINLRKKKADAQKAGKESKALSYAKEIASKTAFLTEYSKARNDELAMLRRNLINDDAFYSSLYDVIKKIAESEGYTMVLSLQEGGSIIWYSPTVDITRQVIQELSKS